jgi:hypothetical protein
MTSQVGALTVDRENVRYFFCCPGCGSQGLLTISIHEHAQVGCPEECGASFIQWKKPDGNYALTCVVQPFSTRRPE